MPSNYPNWLQVIETIRKNGRMWTIIEQIFLKYSTWRLWRMKWMHLASCSFHFLFWCLFSVFLVLVGFWRIRTNVHCRRVSCLNIGRCMGRTEARLDPMPDSIRYPIRSDARLDSILDLIRCSMRFDARCDLIPDSIRGSTRFRYPIWTDARLVLIPNSIRSPTRSKARFDSMLDSIPFNALRSNSIRSNPNRPDSLWSEKGRF